MPRFKMTLFASIFCFVTIFQFFIYNDRLPQAYAVTTASDLFDKQILYLPFEGSTFDASGNGNHGTAKNTLNYTAGTIGDQATDMTQGGYVNIADYNKSNSKFRFGATQDFSISFWMKANSSVIGTADSTIVSNKDWSSGNNQGWEIGVYQHYLTWNFKGASLARMDLHKSSLNNTSPVQLIVDDNQWHHIVVAHNRSGDATFYMDNALKKTININGAGTIDPTTILNLNVGVDGKQSIPFKGQLDDFRMFTKALSSDEVQLLYNIKSTRNNNDAPVWPAGSALAVTPVGPNGVQLTWPQANANAAGDSVGVTQYLVYKNNNLLASLDRSTNTYPVNGLTASELVSFRVEAMDRLGNVTYNGLSTSYRVPGIGLNYSQANLTVGETVALEASVYPPDTPLQWDIDNTGIGRIEPNGNKAIITGLAAGTANVTVTGAGVTATCKVTVSAQSIPDASGKVHAYATDDTYVQGSPGTSNYGNQSTINIKNSTAVDTYLRYGFVKYDLSGIPRGDADSIESVKLAVYGTIADSRATDATVQDITAFEVSGDNWNESAITYNNMPAMGNSIQATTFTNKPDWHEIDVTTYAKARLAANKQVSVALKEVSGDYTVNVYSKENTAGPYASYLEITYKLTRPHDTLWPNGEQISIQNKVDGGVQLSWPGAVDVLGVDKYRISMDGKVIATVPATDRSFSLKALRPGSTYTFNIEAGVTTGQWVVPALSKTYLMPGNIMASPDEAADLLDYRFEHTPAEDSSPAHHDGIPVGSPVVSYDPNYGKNVLSLDGSGAYVRVPHQPELSPAYMSIAASFSLEDLYKAQTIVAKNNQSDYALEYNPVTRKLEARFYVWDMFGNNGSYVIVESASPLQANQIYHAVATYDGLTAKLYLGGMQVGSQSRTGAIGGSTKSDLAIGASLDSAGNASGYLKGKIGFVQLYSKVFAAADVLTLYNAYLAGSTPEDVASIRWSIPAEWTVGQTGQATVKKKNGSGVESDIQQGVIYQSMNPEVATVSASGLISPLRTGTAVLIAKYGANTANIVITVKDRNAQYMTMTGPSRLKVGERGTVQASVYYDNGSYVSMPAGIVYSSSAPSVAAINGIGNVQAASAGQAVLHAEWNGLTADWILDVVNDSSGGGPTDPQMPQMTGLIFTGPKELKVGQAANTVTKAVYSDGSLKGLSDKPQYFSSDSSIASIDPTTGFIQAKKPGTVSFTVISGHFNVGFSMTVVEQETTKPDKKLMSVQLGGTLASLQVGDQADYKLEAIYDDLSTADVTAASLWQSSNASVLRVDAPGRMTGLQAGAAVVTATYGKLSAQAAMTVMAKPAPPGGGSSSGDDSSSDNNSSSGSGPSSSSGSSHGGGGGIVETAKPDSSVRVIVESDRTQSGANVAVKLGDNVSEVLIPAGAGQWFPSKPLRIEQHGLQVAVPGRAVQSILAGNGNPLSQQTNISLTFPVLSDSSRSQLIQAAAAGEGANVSPLTSVYDFKLSVKEDQSNKAVTQWADPIQLTFPMPANADAELVGVYRISNDGTLVYVGGVNNGTSVQASITEGGKYALLEYRKNYEDVPAEHWAYRTIQIMSAQHKVEGVSNTQFDPNRAITRAEFVTLLTKQMNIPADRKAGFTDVPADAWYTPYIGAAAAAGLIEGKADGRFDPEAPISREEMSALLVRAYDRQSVRENSSMKAEFADADQISPWSKDYVNRAAALGLVEGKGNGRFSPIEHATRAEAVQVMLRWLHKGQ